MILRNQIYKKIKGSISMAEAADSIAAMVKEELEKTWNEARSKGFNGEAYYMGFKSYYADHYDKP
jgi:hypothetical protein